MAPNKLLHIAFHNSAQKLKVICFGSQRHCLKKVSARNIFRRDSSTESQALVSPRLAARHDLKPTLRRSPALSSTRSENAWVLRPLDGPRLHRPLARDGRPQQPLRVRGARLHVAHRLRRFPRLRRLLRHRRQRRRRDSGVPWPRAIAPPPRDPRRGAFLPWARARASEIVSTLRRGARVPGTPRRRMFPPRPTRTRRPSAARRSR